MQPSRVIEAAVVGIPDAVWGEAVTAFIVPRGGAGVDEAELLAFARERLAGYKVPKSIRVVDGDP